MASRNNNNNHKNLRIKISRMIKATNIIILTGILFLAIIPAAYAPSIGVLPSEVDLGRVSRGEDVKGELYLSSASDKVLRFSGSYIIPVSNPWFFRYLSEYSEEDISGWISFPEKEFDIDGTKAFSVKIGDVITRANKKFEFTAHIPKNAEPGYHAGSINFYPIATPGKGPEVTLFGVVRPNFVFRVNGEVVRKGAITKIEAERVSENQAKIIIYFKNTGTNTISSDNSKSSVKIYNSDNEIRAELEFSGINIKPGEEKKAAVMWYSREGIKDGKYMVSATINYRNDQASRSEFVTIPSMITVAPAQSQLLNVPAAPAEAILSTKSCASNWNAILILSLITGLIIYWRLPHATIKDVILMSGGVFLILTIINYLLFCYRSTLGVIAIILLLAVAIYYRIPGKRY